MMTPTLTSSFAKSIIGLCNLRLQIGDNRPRFSRMLRPSTWLKTHVISISLFIESLNHWNKQASGDQSKITEHFSYHRLYHYHHNHEIYEIYEISSSLSIVFLETNRTVDIISWYCQRCVWMTMVYLVWNLHLVFVLLRWYYGRLIKTSSVHWRLRVCRFKNSKSKQRYKLIKINE